MPSNDRAFHAGWGMCGIEIEDATDELWLATAPELDHVTGQYYVGKRKRSMPAVVRDASARQRLWELLEQQTELK
jgi:hypothetical protein